MIVTAMIHNVPPTVRKGKYNGEFMVVRRDSDNASLWYYGVYRDEQEATDVSVSIGNGFVVQIGGENDTV